MTCDKCGAQLNEGARFCEACGEPIGGSTCGAQPEQGAYEQGAYEQGECRQETYTPPPEYESAQNGSTFVCDDKDIADNRVLAILAYLGPLCFVPYFGAKESPYAQYHGLRGVNFFIVFALAALGASILGALPLIGWLFGGLLSLAVYAGGIYLMIKGIVNANRGVCADLPFIGSIRIVKGAP